MKYFIILTVFFISSCSPKFHLGIYASSNMPYSFEFKSDSTFHYRYQSYFIGAESDGTWRKSGEGKIILNSNIKRKTLSVYGFDSVSSDVGSNNTSCLLIMNANIPKAQKNCYECLIFINASLYKKQNCDSLDFMPIDKKVIDLFLKIHSYVNMPGRFYDTLTSEKYYKKIEHANRLNVDVIFNDSFFNYKVFNNEELQFSKKLLKYYDSTSNEWIKLPLGHLDKWW